MARDRLDVLHIAAHPDDELIGPPASLLALRDAGHRVVSYYCSFGRTGVAERRRGEAVEASARAGFEFLEPAVPAQISSDDDLEDAAQRLTGDIGLVLEQVRPAIVVSPSVHDRHPAHELVARVVRDILESAARRGPAPVWWMWGIWAELELPTLATGFGEERLGEILSALEAYAGELERNDYRRLVRGRAELNASWAPERIFGFGSGANEFPYVEVLTEVAIAHGTWRLGRPRWLDADQPLEAPGESPVDDWLHAPSVDVPRRSGGTTGDPGRPVERSTNGPGAS